LAPPTLNLFTPDDVARSRIRTPDMQEMNIGRPNDVRRHSAGTAVRAGFPMGFPHGSVRFDVER
jgi:hypothetical protein